MKQPIKIQFPKIIEPTDKKTDIIGITLGKQPNVPSFLLIWNVQLFRFSWICILHRLYWVKGSPAGLGHLRYKPQRGSA